MDDQRTDLIRKLYASRSGTLALAALLISVVMIIVAIPLRQGPASAVLSAIAASLIAASLFSSLHSYFTGEELAELIREQQRQTSLELLTETKGSIPELFVRFMPTDTYESADLNTTMFNADLNRDLAASNNYDFVGLSGKYVGVRLRSVECHLDLLRLEIADINHEPSMRARLRYEMSYPKHATDFAGALQEARDNLLFALVGLYAIRGQVERTEVLFATTAPPGRFERLDNSIYVTPFEGSWRGPLTFPTSYRFDRDSLIYSMQQRDFLVKFETATSDRLWRLTADESKDDFRSRLASIGLPSNPEEFESMLQLFAQRSSAFRGPPRRAS